MNQMKKVSKNLSKNSKNVWIHLTKCFWKEVHFLEDPRRSLLVIYLQLILSNRYITSYRDHSSTLKDNNSWQRVVRNDHYFTFFSIFVGQTYWWEIYQWKIWRLSQSLCRKYIRVSFHCRWRSRKNETPHKIVRSVVPRVHELLQPKCNNINYDWILTEVFTELLVLNGIYRDYNKKVNIVSF